MLDTTQATLGRVYGGNPTLCHIADGTRRTVGFAVAESLTLEMRRRANDWSNPLCPGCYMVAIVNAAMFLATHNGQSLTELGNSLSLAFAKVADGGGLSEEIVVMLDPD
jgi:hypothetical protein